MVTMSYESEQSLLSNLVIVIIETIPVLKLISKSSSISMPDPMDRSWRPRQQIPAQAAHSPP